MSSLDLYRYITDSLKKEEKNFKRYIKKYIPEKFFDVPKKGFSVPIKEWSRNELKDEIKKKLNQKNLERIPGLNIDIFNHLMSRHFSGKLDFSLQIWRVYVLTLWFDNNIKSK